MTHIVPEPFRSRLIQASKEADPTIRIAAIDSVARDLRESKPNLFPTPAEQRELSAKWQAERDERKAALAADLKAMKVAA
jgi:predicted pyridoxine 5'-phosphate oxidase superfamily flavin-nucleotide-binding protein